jgi:hypothetical protein
MNMYVFAIARSGDNGARRRAGRTLSWPTVPTAGAGETAFYVYSNAGSGPLDYSTPIATVYGTTWTSSALTYPDDWRFGVRAFNAYGTEQNVEAAVEIVLNSRGADITTMPDPPSGLRAFATVGGGVRAEWGYMGATGPKTPTGFHVYLGIPAALLSPVSPVRRTSSSKPRLGRRETGRQTWRGAVGGGPNYGLPVATVSYASSINGSFVSNLGPLTGGVIYVLSVRAYNATAEEQNTHTVSVTAVTVGPSAVTALTASATV